MPSKRRILILGLLAVHVSAAAHAAETASPFSLIGIIRPVSTEGGLLTVWVSTRGTPVPAAELTDAENWRLGIVTDPEGTRPVPIQRVDWHAGTKQAALVVRTSDTYNAKLADAGWVVAFVGSQLSVASVDAPAGGALEPAKGKDDASLYAFGSVLVGPSTKSLYVIDLKADYGDEFGRGWLWNVGFTANTNTGVTPPVNKVSVNPDAITAGFSLVKRRNVSTRWLDAVKLEIDPIKAEFTRADAVADAITAAQLQLDLRPIANTSTIYPFVGYEFGHSIRRPHTIKDLPVDLTGWNGIARLVLGVSAQWTLFKAKPTEDDWYILTAAASYTARALGAAEPFTRPATVDGAEVIATTVNKDIRHHAEAELDWNFFKYASLALKYQYGAEPPLFPLVDHQLSLGITLKAKQK